MNEVQIFGYCRVSTKDQHEDRQVIAMQKFGVPDTGIVVEKMSGKDFNRPIYQRLIEKLQPGDTLVLKSLDRLGRDYDAIIAEWKYLTKDKGIAIVIIDIPLLDTRQKGFDLTSSFVADLVLAILSYVAETERAHNRQRQAEGIAAAKARGVKFGRRPIRRPAAFGAVHELWKCGEISGREAARQLKVSPSTFTAWVSDGRIDE